MYGNICLNNVYTFYFSHITTFIIFSLVVHVTSIYFFSFKHKRTILSTVEEEAWEETGQGCESNSKHVTETALCTFLQPHGSARVRQMQLNLCCLQTNGRKWTTVLSFLSYELHGLIHIVFRHEPFMTQGNRVPTSKNLHWTPSKLWSVIQMSRQRGAGANFPMTGLHLVRASGMSGIMWAWSHWVLEPWMWAGAPGKPSQVMGTSVYRPGEGSCQMSTEPVGLVGLAVSVHASSLGGEGRFSLTDHGSQHFQLKIPAVGVESAGLMAMLPWRENDRSVASGHLLPGVQTSCPVSCWSLTLPFYGCSFLSPSSSGPYFYFFLPLPKWSFPRLLSPSPCPCSNWPALLATYYVLVLSWHSF